VEGAGIEHGSADTVKALSRHIGLIVIALTAGRRLALGRVSQKIVPKHG
jgi:hypothetical protein